MKSERDILTPKFTRQQMERIKALVDAIAGSPSEVVSRIVMMWLKDNHDYVTEIIKDKNKKNK